MGVRPQREVWAIGMESFSLIVLTLIFCADECLDLIGGFGWTVIGRIAHLRRSLE